MGEELYIQHTQLFFLLGIVFPYFLRLLFDRPEEIIINNVKNHDCVHIEMMKVDYLAIL